MDPCLVLTRFSWVKLVQVLAHSLMDQSRSGTPEAGTAGKEFESYTDFCGKLLNDCPPLMRVSPTVVEAPPAGGFDSHWHLLSSLLLLRPCSFAPPVSSAVAGRRSQPSDGSGWAMVLLSIAQTVRYLHTWEFMHMRV